MKLIPTSVLTTDPSKADYFWVQHDLVCWHIDKNDGFKKEHMTDGRNQYWPQFLKPLLEHVGFPALPFSCRPPNP